MRSLSQLCAAVSGWQMIYLYVCSKTYIHPPCWKLALQNDVWSHEAAI